MQPRLFWQIHKLAFLLEKRADENLKDYTGIGFAQYKVLETIGAHTNAQQNTVAELLDQTEAGISRQVKILEKKNLISIGMVMGNKRARELSVTENGEVVLRQSAEILDAVQDQVLGSLSHEEQKYFQLLFERMITIARL